MVCAHTASETELHPIGDAALPDAVARRMAPPRASVPLGTPEIDPLRCETPDDPFDDFEDDDFDDEFDDDFEEDWEDDLTEDEEFPDTFGGEEPDEPVVEGEEESPFSDDPDFDD